MTRSSRSTRTPANLSESINHHLNMYVLAAGAAGIGMFTSRRGKDHIHRSARED
jgi:hypothetical protein